MNRITLFTIPLFVIAVTGCGNTPTALIGPNDGTPGGTIVDGDSTSGGSPLKAGIYNGTIECLRRFIDGSSESYTQEWIVGIGDSGIPMIGTGKEMFPGMVLQPPPNSESPPETVLNVIVSTNAVVILTEYDDQASLCTNSCPFSFDGACDDGSTGSTTSLCQVGSDCSDCGNFLVPVSGTIRSTYNAHTVSSIEYISSESSTFAINQKTERRDCTGILVR